MRHTGGCRNNLSQPAPRPARLRVLHAPLTGTGRRPVLILQPAPARACHTSPSTCSGACSARPADPLPAMAASVASLLPNWSAPGWAAALGIALFAAAVVHHALRLRRIARQGGGGGGGGFGVDSDAAVIGAFLSRGEPPTQCRYCGVKLSHASSNAELVRQLVANGVLAPRLAPVFAEVDRGVFLDGLRDCDLPFPGRGLYLDCAYAVGCNAQISAPHIHALTLGLLQEALQRQRQRRRRRRQRQRQRVAEAVRPAAEPLAPAPLAALDIGSGTGFVTACLAVLVDEDDDGDDGDGDEHGGGGGGGTVVGKEHMPELVTTSVAACDRVPRCRAMRRAGRFRIVVGDGRNCACPVTLGQTFDAIHCGAAVEEIPPALLRLLRPGGRLVVPVGSAHASDQVITTVDRLPHDDGGGSGGSGGKDGDVGAGGATFHRQAHFGIRVQYIPLTSREAQSDDAQCSFEDDDGCSGGSVVGGGSGNGGGAAQLGGGGGAKKDQ